jgi:hypothetical protein
VKPAALLQKDLEHTPSQVHAAAEEHMGDGVPEYFFSASFVRDSAATRAAEAASNAATTSQPRRILRFWTAS